MKLCYPVQYFHFLDCDKFPSAYLKLLIFLTAILIPACDSSSLTLHIMFSACKLNKQGDSIQPWHTPFPVWKLSFAACLVLTIASWLICVLLNSFVNSFAIILSALGPWHPRCLTHYCMSGSLDRGLPDSLPASTRMAVYVCTGAKSPPSKHNWHKSSLSIQSLW